MVYNAKDRAVVMLNHVLSSCLTNEKKSKGLCVCLFVLLNQESWYFNRNNKTQRDEHLNFWETEVFLRQLLMTK